jgi:carboxynorspermidine decarboxylase
MSLNSLNQYKTYAKICTKHTSVGLRINPKLSLKQPKYCDSNQSRLGVDYKEFLQNVSTLNYLEGLHFHPFCNQNVDAFATLMEHINTNYQDILPKLKWINFGGGQNFMDDSYETSKFISYVNRFRALYPNLRIYFEPASAVLYECGYFEATIMDIIQDDIPIVILNTSIEAHLLDIAITKQTPKIRNSSISPTPYQYELTGMSCIAGDIIGRYYFKTPLCVGDKIVFEDMLAYTMVKETSFNGIKQTSFVVV